MLAEYGLIQQAEYGWVRTFKPVDRTSSTTMYRAILNDFPAYRSKHQVLKCTGSRLADCFSAKADALQLLFRNEKSHERLEEVENREKPLSILELGVGTGGATKYVLEQLISHGIDFDYTLTDISSALGTWACQCFGHYKQLRFTDLAIEKTPPGEHVDSYDIIISSNCIHATKDLDTSCRNIFSLLRPNGMLCLSELTRDIF
ncbi:S-adenosyl-L-methionine-dependent methyltransferase [Aspergillus alliaceus]|uniref:S-adenosyl-L-methionine-dependent methyltransferase n=1 Tax=Petromyces alliaceus TaxID=209559 RepID=A0A5N7CCJ7_PETAA|nr:S-adenosyl-L-methionine-dependent methyltransferase [Aspergillus alliaceus]